MESSNLTCIIHYKVKDKKYCKIKPISNVNQERIFEAKLLREKKGGSNHHEEQCCLIPQEIDHSRDGIHHEPCYKIFSLILSTESQTLTGEKRQCTRLSSPPPQNKRSLFPTTCYFCKNDRVKHKQHIKFPITITTEQAPMSIKQNAESMEDKTIYFEIKDVDLIAKELRYHRHCYKEFTRKKLEKLLNVNETQKGDCQKVKDIIEKLVLNQNQAVSMANIHNAYALHPNDTRYRSKLKERIENDYKKQLLFVKIKITALM